MLERYGSGSRCVEYAQAWRLQHCDVTHDVDAGSGCYEVRGTWWAVGGKVRRQPQLQLISTVA